MSRAYYNEIDPCAAAWLRELINQGLIAPGDVDQRSIEDVCPADLVGYSQCHFFAGIGGWSYALRIAGWPDYRPVWTGSCPCQPFSDAGKGGGFDDERHLWPAFHWLISQCRPPVIFGEQVASKDGLAWLDLVCSDLEGSDYAAGAADLCAAGLGAPHIRQRLYWVANARGSRIRDQRPGAHACAARGVQGQGLQREWIRQNAGDDGGGCAARMANANKDGRESPTESQHDDAGRDAEPCSRLGNADAPGLPLRESAALLGAGGGYERRAVEQSVGASDPWDGCEWIYCRDGKWRPVEPAPVAVADGIPGGMVLGGSSRFPLAAKGGPEAEGRVMRLKGYGNAIVPQVAAEFIGACSEAMA